VPEGPHHRVHQHLEVGRGERERMSGLCTPRVPAASAASRVRPAASRRQAGTFPRSFGGYERL
jgi:hypothetical protein